MKQLATGAAIAAVVLAGCGGGKEPPPFKTVPQTATTGASAATDTQTSGSFHGSFTDLGPHYNRVFAQLIDRQDALDDGANAVTVAVADAQALADRIADGNNPPSGAAPQVMRLRAALTSFNGALRAMVTSGDQLPKLSVELQLRAARLHKRATRTAAALLTAKQQVDAAIEQIAGLDRAIFVAETKVKQQVSKVALDADPLRAAATSAGDSTETAVSTVDRAVSAGFEALIRASDGGR